MKWQKVQHCAKLDTSIIQRNFNKPISPRWEEITPAPFLPCNTSCCLPPLFSKTTRKNSARPGFLRCVNPAGTPIFSAGCHAPPDARPNSGRINNLVQTNAATGLPGRQKISSLPRRPTAIGRPGFMARRQKTHSAPICNMAFCV